jgi:hypothetical protein
MAEELALDAFELINNHQAPAHAATLTAVRGSRHGRFH